MRTFHLHDVTNGRNAMDISSQSHQPKRRPSSPKEPPYPHNPYVATAPWVRPTVHEISQDLLQVHELRVVGEDRDLASSGASTEIHQLLSTKGAKHRLPGGVFALLEDGRIELLNGVL